jgi:N-acetylglucosamine-6-phosphate deacetylase
VPKAPLVDVIKMASLTPARIIGLDNEIGSIQVGKRADLVILDEQLNVRDVFIGGRRFLGS